MRCTRLVRLFLPIIVWSVAALPVRAENEETALNNVIGILDHFMQAGVDKDASRGAELLQAFERNERRAEYDTRMLYQRKKELLESYVSIGSDIYGYEIDEGLMGTSVELEGGIETLSGVTAEFKARVVYNKKRWLIADFEID